MPIEIASLRDGILRVKLTGTRDASTLRSVWQHVGDQCRKHGAAGILWESHLTGRISAADMYEVAQTWQDYGVVGVKIALVHLEQESFDDSVFGTMVAANRGMAVELFDNVDAAERWLVAELSGD